MKKILYVHYQKDASEGSMVHVTRFSEEFAGICRERGIAFGIIQPPKVFTPPGRESTSLLRRVKSWLSRHYLREFKVLLQQGRQYFRDLQMLRREAPDMVLTRYNAETLSIHWACRRLGIPVVTEFNGQDRAELADSYSTFKQFAAVNRLFSNCNALNWSAGAMAVSPPIANALLACNPERKPVIVNHNGVVLGDFDPAVASTAIRQQLAIPEGAVVVGYVGSFIVWHSPARLIQAFKAIVDAGVDAYLLLVGRKVPEVEALVAAAGPELASRVRMAGFVAHDDIPPYLGLMDITVLPNTQAYCSPLKLFEYMAMRKACLAPATETIHSIIVDGEEGVLFDPESDAAFTEGLLRLARDGALRERLGAAARARVEREFTWRHNAERVMVLLDAAQAWTRQRR